MMMSSHSHQFLKLLFHSIYDMLQTKQDPAWISVTFIDFVMCYYNCTSVRFGSISVVFFVCFVCV